MGPGHGRGDHGLDRHVPSSEVLSRFHFGQGVRLARPDEHKEIAEVVQEMSRPEPAETARKIAVYTVPTAPGDPAGTPGALALLSAMFSDAKFSAGAEPGTVVAWARPEDHKVIAQAVEEVSKKPPPGKARTMVSYTLESSERYGDPAGRVALIQSLRQAFSDALFFPGATRGRVVVWARPDDHAAIKNAFEEMSKREPLESARASRATRWPCWAEPRR